MSRSKRKIFAIDCETDPFKLGRTVVPFLWDAFDGEKHYTFEHVSDLKHFLERQPCIAYAHNGGRFDFLMPGFTDGMEEGDSVMLINGRLAKFSIGECEYRDSMCIYPEGLATFCKEVIDYDKLEKKNRKKHAKEILHYLHVDTDSLYKLVRYFIDTYGLHLTIAGAAMSLWGEMSDHDVPQSTETYFKDNKRWYYGGRVQCFMGGIINTTFSGVDINSAYPFAMLQEHAYSTTYEDELDVSKSAKIRPQSFYTIRARSKGALPFKDDKGIISYPDDENTRLFHVTGWELQAGLDTQTVDISEILLRRTHDGTINFSPYINHFYRLKQDEAEKQPDKKSAGYLFSKRMMNALSGKFGAHCDTYLKYRLTTHEYASFITDCQLCEGVGCIHCKHSGKSDQYAICGTVGPWSIIGEGLDDSEKRYYNICTVASITGHTRAYLWRAICAARRAGREILYCDTDSLFFSGASIPDFFTIGKRLGEWSADRTYAKGGIAGKKLYAFNIAGSKEWKTASKGGKLTAKEIMKVAGGRTVTYHAIAQVQRFGNKPRWLSRTFRQTGEVARRDKRT